MLKHICDIPYQEHRHAHTKDEGEHLHEYFEENLSRLMAGNTIDLEYEDGDKTIRLVFTPIKDHDGSDYGNVHVQKTITRAGMEDETNCFIAIL